MADDYRDWDFSLRTKTLKSKLSFMTKECQELQGAVEEQNYAISLRDRRIAELEEFVKAAQTYEDSGDFSDYQTFSIKLKELKGGSDED